MTLPRTASLLLSHIRSPRWLQASSSFPAGQSRMQPRISEQDRGNEHPTPSNGTEVYWWGLSQNYAAFLYDKWHLYAVTGKLVRKHKECMLDPGTEQSLILSGSLGKNHSQSLAIAWNIHKENESPSYPISSCSFSPAPGHTGGWDLCHRYPFRWLSSGYGTNTLASAQAPHGSNSQIHDGSSQVEAIPDRIATDPQGVAANSSSHTQLPPDWEDSRAREVNTLTSKPVQEISMWSEQMCRICNEGKTPPPAKQQASPTHTKPASKLGLITP